MLSDKQLLQIKNDAEEMGISKPYLNVVAFARAIERAAYERAAQECDSMAYEPLGLDVNSCIACADAIRALGAKGE